MSGSTLAHKTKAIMSLKAEQWDSTTHLSTREISQELLPNDFSHATFSFIDTAHAGTAVTIPAVCKYLIIQNKNATEWISVTLTDATSLDVVVRIPALKFAILPNIGRMVGITTVLFETQTSSNVVIGIGIVS